MRRNKISRKNQIYQIGLVEICRDLIIYNEYVKIIYIIDNEHFQF